jgi:2-polyprenyl-3-methyl-5-hydroxy-6-metoxy-1,4-benzoquinol methylase
MDEKLSKFRIHAAQQSGGRSSKSIKALVHSIVEEKGLEGLVLDFGAGRGELTNWLLEKRFFSEIHALDLCERPAGLPESIQWHVSDLNESVSLDRDGFDVVICTEVIEHLENPRHVFRSIWKLLKNGGALVLTTPNQESLRSFVGLLFGGHFTHFLASSYPAHITALLRLDLIRLCDETGFEVPEFYWTDNGCIPGWTSRKWQGLSLGLLKGRLFSDNLGMFTVKRN